MLLELTPVVRYWELTPKELQNRLDNLRDLGADSIAAFVPWNFLETDRQHLLQKFLRYAFEIKLKVKICITPELGIGYWNNGLPEDILKERSQLAQDRTGQYIYNCAPPNIHPLPSLSSPNVFQKYGHFLLKLSQELQEVCNEAKDFHLDLVVSDSLFKHYFVTGLNPEDHGDFSVRYLHQGSSGVSQGANPSGAESIFTNRTRDFLKVRFQKFKGVSVREQKFFSRSFSLDRLAEEMAQSGANLPTLFQQMTSARAHSQVVWLDDLSELSDRERNFLISSSLVLYQQLWLNDDIYMDCSSAFRRRILGLIEGFSQDEAKQTQTASIVVANRFAPARVAQILRSKLGARLNFETLHFGPLPTSFKEKKLLIIEEGLPLEFSQYTELLSLAEKNTTTVVIFRSSLCERSLRDLMKRKKFKVQNGWNYDVVINNSGGQTIFIEGHETSINSLESLCASIINVAQLDPWCTMDQPQESVYSVAIDWDTKEDTDLKTLFLFNPSPDPKKISLKFNSDTKVQGIFLGENSEKHEPQKGENLEGTLPGFSVVPLTAYLAKNQSTEAQIDARSATELAQI